MRRNWTPEQRSWTPQQWAEQDRLARDRLERQRFEQQRAEQQQRWNIFHSWGSPQARSAASQPHGALVEGARGEGRAEQRAERRGQGEGRGGFEREHSRGGGGNRDR